MTENTEDTQVGIEVPTDAENEARTETISPDVESVENAPMERVFDEELSPTPVDSPPPSGPVDPPFEPKTALRSIEIAPETPELPKADQGQKITFTMYCTLKKAPGRHQAGMRAFTKLQRATFEEWERVFTNY